jgi:hypothetical protein
MIITTNDPWVFSSHRALALHRTSLIPFQQGGVFQLIPSISNKAASSHDFNTCIGNYRVVALGPKNERTGEYEWSVVSTPFRASMFILARNITVRQ